MDGTLVDGLRAELDAEREQLARLVAEYDALLEDDDVIQEDRDLAAQLVAEARAAVTRIEQAIAGAEAGTYGHCVRCGQDIPAARLEALPSAQTCVSCG